MTRGARIGTCLILLTAAAHAGDPVKEAPAFTGGDLQKYYTDVCARCHGATGSGRDAAGRQLPDAGFDFTDSRKANKKKDSDWVKVTLQGKDKMPAFQGKLSEADAQRMIAEVLRKFAAKH